METTYKIIGGDGKEYGPASLAEMQSWVNHGRVSGTTQVQRSDQGTWAAAASFSELPLPPQPGLAPGIITGSSLEQLQLPATLKRGANWFYWIAGLSLINTVIALSGGSVRFVFGLGITMAIDSAAKGMGGGAAVAVVLDLIVAGLFVLFGVFAAKGRNWAFLTGLVLYALDGLLMLLFQEWIGVIVHAWALVAIFRGFQASRQLKAN